MADPAPSLFPSLAPRGGRCAGAGGFESGLFLSGAPWRRSAAGDVVTVPLGARDVVGVVWGGKRQSDPRLHNRLKDVGDKVDVPRFRQELRDLVDWVANYTLSARGMVLRMTLRMGEPWPRTRAARRAAGR